MINRYKGVLAALLFLALPACNDDAWLTEVPRDFIGPDNFFRNASDALAAVNSLYGSNGFIQPGTCGADNYYGRDFIMLVEYPSEAVTSRYGATHERGSIDAFNITVEHPILANTWVCAYAAIANANLVINRVPQIADANIDPGLRNRFLGEARFLRALHYFNLVRAFGDVPLRLEPVTTLQNLTIPRSPASEVYAAIIADLEFAAQNLPPMYAGVGGANTGRTTSVAAHALLSKVHLQFGAVHGGGAASFNRAADHARQVIASGRHQLLPDFARIFALDNEMNAEVIFAVQLTRIGGLGGRLGQHVAPIGGGLSGAHTGGISFYPEWPFYRDWPDADRRKEATFITTYTHPTHGTLTWTRPQPGRTNAQVTAFLNQFGTPGGGPIFRKYLDPQAASGAGDENDIILLRYADVLLMLAEAINLASGPTAEAYDAVNQVRARAGLPALAAGLNQQAFHDAVHLERRYELVLEGHGFFDSQRNWEWAKAHIQAGRPVAQGGEGLNTAPWGNSVPKVGLAGGIVEDRYRFFPIPAAARRTNPELTQNPGWEA
jgi:starch-binding outer membrane protein, SusD/RagB family